MYFVINETLENTVPENIKELKKQKRQYAALLTSEEWKSKSDIFDMGIDFEPDTTEIHSSHAEENYDSVTGAFCIPDRNNFWEEFKFAFALDENGIVFIDDGGKAAELIGNLSSKKWRFPCLERFLYDFLEQIIKDDLRLMENYESELGKAELDIVNDTGLFSESRTEDIRGNIRDIMTHYEQLLDLSEVLEENENNFFAEENLRYFRMFSKRIERLRDRASSVRDYAIQIRELYKSRLETKQNRIMTLLTVVTTIFMPLTLITGWFGMNFKYMPELEMKYAYPAVIAISILIVIGSLIFFKKKKWL